MGRLVYFQHDDTSLVSDVFIETGTFRGKTLTNASKQNFNELHSIEIDDFNFKEASRQFKEGDNVHIYHGSSPDILPKIINPKRATTFWLDAHFQGGRQEEQDPSIGQCPLMEELNIIFSYDWKIMPLVLVDDADIFTNRKFTPNKGFLPEQWPTIEEIKEAIPNNYTVSTCSNNIMYCLP